MMNTQLPILNPVSSANTAPHAAPAESARAETPFNQILNKEVNNRKSDSSANTATATANTSNNANATNASANSSNVANSATQPQTATQSQSKPVDSTQDSTQDNAKDNEQDAAVAGAATVATATAASSKTGKTVSIDHKQDRTKQDDEHETSNAASAQMLALVSNLGQMDNHPIVKKTVNGHAEDPADRKSDKKLISAIGVGAGIDAKEKFSHLKSEDGGKGKAISLNLDDHQEMAAGGKEQFGNKSGTSLRTASERALPEASLTAGSALTSAQEKDLATGVHNAKLPEAANAKPIEGAQQPNPLILAPALQQAMSLNQQVAMTGQPTERLTPTVGSPGWDEAVGQKVAWMATGGLQSASMTLNPPDLGPLQVVLHVHNDQADATFITAQPEVKQALEAAMPKLREMMDQAGIQLGQATVSTGMPNQQQGQQQMASGRGGSGGFGKGDKDEVELNVTTIGVRPAASGSLGLVDTFA